MRAGHVIGIGAVAATVIATLMAGNAPAFVEDLDGPAGHADIDLGTDQAVGHGAEELLDLDVPRPAGATRRRSGMAGPTFAAMRLQAG